MAEHNGGNRGNFGGGRGDRGPFRAQQQFRGRPARIPFRDHRDGAPSEDEAVIETVSHAATVSAVVLVIVRVVMVMRVRAFVTDKPFGDRPSREGDGDRRSRSVSVDRDRSRSVIGIVSRWWSTGRP